MSKECIWKDKWKIHHSDSVRTAVKLQALYSDSLPSDLTPPLLGQYITEAFWYWFPHLIKTTRISIFKKASMTDLI